MGVCSCVFLRYGIAPIHYATQQGHSSALELLIAKNADINARNKSVLLMMAMRVQLDVRLGVCMLV